MKGPRVPRAVLPGLEEHPTGIRNEERWQFLEMMFKTKQKALLSESTPMQMPLARAPTPLRLLPTWPSRQERAGGASSENQRAPATAE